MRRLVASRGVFRHWQAADAASLSEAPVEQLRGVLERGETRPIPANSVWTFNVGADSVYGTGNQFDFDSFALLRLAPEFSAWQLRLVNVPLKF
jgi:hypothetical protein